MRNALIIVDLQNDFVEEGSLAVEGGKRLATQLARDFEKLKENYSCIVTTQDWHVDPGSHFATEGESPNFKDNWPEHCVANTFGSEIVEVLNERLNGNVDIVIKKGEYEDAYSGFMGKDENGEGLADLLKEFNIDHVDIVGIAADYCVAQSAIDASKEGFSVRVLSKYTVAINEERLSGILEDEFKDFNVKFE